MQSAKSGLKPIISVFLRKFQFFSKKRLGFLKISNFYENVQFIHFIPKNFNFGKENEKKNQKCV